MNGAIRATQPKIRNRLMWFQNPSEFNHHPFDGLTIAPVIYSDCLPLVSMGKNIIATKAAKIKAPEA